MMERPIITQNQHGKEVQGTEVGITKSTGRSSTTETGTDFVIDDEEALFNQYVIQWRVEKRIMSSLSDMIRCPSYQKIIAMGNKALPLILDQIRREGDDPDHWYAARSAITGEDPTPEDAWGDTVKMAEAWLLWAEKKERESCTRSLCWS